MALPRGGYKMIDFKHAVLNKNGSTKVRIPGIYDAIEGNYYKPILACNVQIGTDAELPDEFVHVKIESSKFVFDYAGYRLTIDSSDDVICAVNELDPAYKVGTGLTVASGSLKTSS